MNSKTSKSKKMASRAAARGYPDLRDHIESLRRAGLLIVVDRPINKDTEMHALVRWQFRGGIAEPDRKAFLFTNIYDAKGRKYDIPVLVAGLAGNRAIYSIGMQCKVDEIRDKWMKAISRPIPPRVVKAAPCQEMVYEGADLRSGHGLDAIPVPISTPGWDNAPYTSSSNVISKDPETGMQNMGTYRGQLKAPDRMGFNMSMVLNSGGQLHWHNWKARGKKMPVAAVLGAPPCVSFTSAQKLPQSLDELHVAGGLAGKPLNVVKAKTVDLLVPAEAEIIVEGLVDTTWLEREGPFGESHGHVNLQEYNVFMDVTCITRRKRPILTSIISQVTPSESSVIKRVALEPVFLDHLRKNLGIQSVKRVSMHEPLTNIRMVIALVMERNAPPTEIWRALTGAATFQRGAGKYVVAINDDIDPDNADSLLWALSYRANPDIDIQTLRHRTQGHGPRSKRNGGEDGCLLIDATLKENFPPISLPKREFMERARVIWEELGLPKLKPEVPWFGYSLGEWGDELEEQAKLAVRGDYFETGKKIAKLRRNDIRMNTEVRNVPNARRRS